MSIGIPQLVAQHRGNLTKIESVYGGEGVVVTGKTSPVLVATASDNHPLSSLPKGGLKPPMSSNFVRSFYRKQTMKQMFNLFPISMSCSALRLGDRMKKNCTHAFVGE